MNEVDKRVVQMEFDNKKFEQNVSETIKSLQKLDEALKINSSTDGLEKTGKSAHKLDKELSNVNDTLVDTRYHFSAIEVIGVTALATLTNSAIKAGAKIARTFTKPLSLAISGGKSRSQNIANAKFMLEGLGVAWEQISGDINYGVKNTAYGLDAAAKVASQLVASNVRLGDDMQHALRAISGVASMTNSTYEEIGEIFTTVAGQGKLMTMQLRQLEARGLNVAASLAKVKKATEADIRSMVTTGKIGFQEFADAMDEAFGAHAKEANKTFSGALSNTKSALSRLGEAFATPTFEAFRKVLNSTIPVIDKVKEALHPLIGNYETATIRLSEYVSKFLESKEVTEAIEKGAYAFYTWIGSIRAALNVIGVKMPDLTNGVSGIIKLLDKLTLSGKKQETVVKAFVTLFQTIKLIHSVIKSLWKMVFPILNLAVKILGIIFGVSGDFFEILYQVEGKLIRILDVVSSLVAAGLATAINLVITVLSKIKFEYIIKVLHIILGIVTALTSVVLQLAGVLIMIVAGLVTSIPSALTAIFGVFGDLLGGANVISDLIRNVFGKKKKTTLAVDTEGLAQASDVEKTAESVDKLNKKLPETEKNIKRINKNISSASKEIQNLGKHTDKVVKGSTNAMKGFSNQLSEVTDGYKDLRIQMPGGNRSNMGDKSRAEYYEQLGVSELEETEKESKNAFERFFDHIVNILNTGKGFIAKAIDGVTSFIVMAYHKLEDFVKRINWFKVILASIAAIAGTLIFEILRAVHVAISAIASVGYLAKGFADKAAAAKLKAWAGTILAFGFVLAALMVVIDSVDSEKLIKGLEAMTKLITRIGMFVISLTIVYSLASIMRSIASALQAMSKIFNVSNLSVVIRPLAQFMNTVTSIFRLLIGSIIAFTLLFDGESGKEKFKQALSQVKEVLGLVGVIFAILAVFAAVLTGLAKFTNTSGYLSEKTIAKTTLFKKTSKTTSNNPFSAFAKALTSIVPVIKMVFRAVIAFALLDKLVGSDNIDKAIKQTRRVILMAVLTITAVTAMLSILYKVVAGDKYTSISDTLTEESGLGSVMSKYSYGETKNVLSRKGMSNPQDITKFFDSVSSVLRAVFGSIKTLMSSVVIFTVLTKYFTDDEIVTAMVRTGFLLAGVLAAAAIIFAMAYKAKDIKAESLEKISNILDSVSHLVIMISASMAILAVVGSRTGPYGLMGMGIAFVSIFAIIALILTQMGNLIKIMQGSPQYDKTINAIKKLINKAVVPLILSLVVAYAAILKISTRSNASYLKMVAAFAIIFGLLCVIAAFIKKVTDEAGLVSEKQVKHIERIIGAAVAVLWSVIASVGILSVIVMALAGTKNLTMAYTKMSLILATVVLIFAGIGLVLAELIKHNEISSNVKKAIPFLSVVTSITTLLISLVSILAYTLVALEESNITSHGIKMFIGVAAIVAAAFTVVGILVASIISTTEYISDGQIRKIIPVLISIMAGVGMYGALIIALATLANTITTSFDKILEMAVIAGVVAGIIWVINQVFIELIAAFNSGKITTEATAKSLIVYLALIGGVCTIASAMPILASAAAQLEDIDLTPLLYLSSMVAIIGTVYGLIALIITKAPAGKTSMVIAIGIFTAILTFFGVFAFVMKKIAGYLNDLAHTDWSGYRKMYAIFGTFIGIFSAMVALVSVIAKFVAVLWPLAVGLVSGVVIMGVLVEFFNTFAKAMLNIATAADILEDINTNVIESAVRAVIFNILPLITGEVLSGLDNFHSFIKTLTASVTMLNDTPVSGSSNIWNWYKFTDLVENLAEAMPLIQKLFDGVSIDLVQKIYKIGEGLQGLAESVEMMSNTSKMTSMSRSAEALKKLFDTLEGINLTNTVDGITKFKDAISGLAPVLITVAAAMFVASIIFAGSFATLSAGPILFAAVLGAVFTGLSSDDGPLGAFGSFIGGIMTQGDGLLSALGHILEGTNTWHDNMLAALDLGAITLGYALGGPLGAGTVLGAEILIEKFVNAAMPGIVGKPADLPTMESEAALNALKGYRKWDEEAGEWLIDLGDVSTDELEAMILAFTDEYRDGDMQSGEDRATMIHFLDLLYKELSKRVDADTNVLAQADPTKQLSALGKAIYEGIRDVELRGRLLEEMRDQLDEGYTFKPDPTLRDDLQEYFDDADKYHMLGDFEDLTGMTADEFLSELDSGITSDVLYLPDILEEVRAIRRQTGHTDSSDIGDKWRSQYYSGTDSSDIGDKWRSQYYSGKDQLLHTDDLVNLGNFIGGAVSGFGGLLGAMDSRPFDNIRQPIVGSAIGNGSVKESFQKVPSNIKGITTNMPIIRDNLFTDIISGLNLEDLWEYVSNFFAWIGAKIPDEIVEAFKTGDLGALKTAFQEQLKNLGLDSDFSSYMNLLNGDAFNGGASWGESIADGMASTLMPNIARAMEDMMTQLSNGLGHAEQAAGSTTVRGRSLSSYTEAEAKKLGEENYQAWVNWHNMYNQIQGYNAAAAAFHGYLRTHGGTASGRAYHTVDIDGNEVILDDDWASKVEDWAAIDAEWVNRYGSKKTASEDPQDPSGPAGNLANDISKSSGPNSGINDGSKSLSGSNGGDVTNIDSNNVTYNYVQNNYSPEALSRIDIYRQTNNQLKTVFDALKG